MDSAAQYGERHILEDQEFQRIWKAAGRMSRLEAVFYWPSDELVRKLADAYDNAFDDKVRTLLKALAAEVRDV
jgi:hypothetical protein